MSEQQIFESAAALPANERQAYLDAACEGRAGMREAINYLLASLEAEAFMQPAGTPTMLESKVNLGRIKAEAVGDQIGSYVLREHVGEGGFGTVWMAEQEKPVRRMVALKIIKLGMDTKQVIARFEQERQALAMMDHPNIAKVLDAGATSFGRPYFVMELVRGIRITEYCDQANLPTAERLRLFIAVCHAVQHAHQKGIIHRDLKPSNILVTLHDGLPVPKVIDFGVAKATQQQRLTDLTLYTQLEQMIGTPLYMSPEQAEMSGLDIDTRSDIYSLGVLLYELLVGHTPFNPETLMKAGFDEMRRVIREQQPQKPSTFVGTMSLDVRTNLAKRRQTDGTKLAGQIRGDLDWIVMKALEKNRTRRYETANSLAKDIQRHLLSEPVQARPPTAIYRFGRMVRRNKLAFLAGTAVAGALIIGLGFSAWSFLREREQYKMADQARAVAEQQRAIADSNVTRAIESENNARHQAYASDMILAQQALDSQDLGQARQLLDRHRALLGKEDIRGWEWRYLWQQCVGHKSTILTRGRFSLSMNHHYAASSLSLSPDGDNLAVAYTDGQVELWDLSRRTLIKVLQPAQLADNRSDAVEQMQTQVAFSPIAECVVASNAAGEVLLYDLTKESASAICLVNVDGEIRDLCYSPDGACVAALYQTLTGGLALVVDVTRQKVILTIPLPEIGNFFFFDCVRFSPDHQWLYLSFRSSGQPIIRCIKVPAGDVLWERVSHFETLSKRPPGITAMAISPDGKTLVTAAGYETADIHVSDASNGRLLATLKGHTDWVADLIFSRDGRRLVSVSADQTVRFWDSATWKSLPPIRGHGEMIMGVALSADGNTLVTGDGDGFVLLCDPHQRVNRGGAIALRDEISFAQILPGVASLLVRDTQQNYSVVELATLNERKLPFSMGQSTWFVPPDLIGIQAERSGLELYQITESVTQRVAVAPLAPSTSSCIAYCPQRRLLAWTDSPKALHVTSVDHPSEQISLDCQEPLDPIAFSEDGSVLLAMNKRRIARVFDIRSKQRMAAAEEYLSPFGSPLMDDMPNPHGLENMPNSWLLKWLKNASLRSNGSIRANELVSPPTGFWPSGSFGNRAFSPDGCTFAVSTAAGRIGLYDAHGPAPLGKFRGRSKAIYSIAFSPDGARLFAPNSGLWDIKSGQLVLQLPANMKNLYHAEWTEDGSTLLAGRRGSQSSFQLWRAPSWEQIEDTERNGGGWRRSE